MEQFLTYTILGLCVAGTFAIAAGGLVLTYSTTGIFNFAHGAIAMLGAFTYWQLRSPDAWGLPAPLALVLTLFVFAPAFGALLEVVVMRRLEGASEAAKVVVSISLLIGFLQLGKIIWPEATPRPFDGFFAGETVTVLGVRVTWHELIALALGIVVAIGLRLLLFNTRAGTAMRASVDDRGLASLHGARPDNSAMLAWAVGCSLAALAGILLAGMQSLSHNNLTLLIVNAFAAAVLGRLKSLPITFVGAILLGLADAYATGYLPSDNLYLTGIRPSVPIILLFIVLLLMPSAPLRGHTARTTVETVPRPQWGRTLLGCAFFLLFSWQLAMWVSPADAVTLGRGFGLSLIAASLIPLIGWAGQISLCSLSFAAIGAIVMARHGAGGSLRGFVFAAVICAVVGALVALPALRLSGLYLALATAAFAVILDRWIFSLPDFHIGHQPIRLFGKSSQPVDPIHLPGIDTSSPRTYLVVLAAVFCLFVLLLTALRRSRFGERLLAMKDSQAAVATLGMNVRRAKLLVFSLSAAMAGVGGAFYGASLGSVNSGYFDFFTGLPIALLVVVGGVGTAWGALFVGSTMTLVPFLLHPLGWLKKPLMLMPAALGITIGRSPNGVAGEFRENFAPFRADRWVEGGVLSGIAVLGIANLAGLLPFAIAAPMAVVLYLVVGGAVSRRIDVVQGAAAATALAAGAVPADGAGVVEEVAVAERGGPIEVDDLAWAGIDRPFTPADLAAMDRALAIQEVPS